MVRLTREHAFMFSNNAYKIFIDDSYRGEINVNETKEFPVDPGKHSIYAKIAGYDKCDDGYDKCRCKSNKLCLEISASVLDIEVGSTLSLLWFLIPVIGCLMIGFFLYSTNIIIINSPLLVGSFSIGAGAFIAALLAKVSRRKYLWIKQKQSRRK